MGTLQYGGQTFQIEDRMLAHIQVLINVKLRRYEPFMLSWLETPQVGRHSLWIDKGMPIRCTFYGNRIPVINRAWLEKLVYESSRAGGVTVGIEPTDE